MAALINEKPGTFPSGLAAFSERLPNWLMPVFISAAILAAALAYLWPSPVEFPMDDAYIHFVYAENLAEHGQLFFSFPAEKGLATSSFLWVILLAAGRLLDIPVHLTAKALGVWPRSSLWPWACTCSCVPPGPRFGRARRLCSCPFRGTCSGFP